jgi:hypothetical protein
MQRNTYESRRGSHVVLEFAEPTASSPTGSPRTSASGSRNHNYGPPPTLSRAASWQGQQPVNGWKSPEPATPGQTRLQQTFEVIKKMSAGLASPRLDYGRWSGSAAEGESEGKSYFDVVVEGQEAD